MALESTQDDPEFVEYLTKTLEENKKRLNLYHQRRQQLSTLINNYQSLKRYLEDSSS
jgi:anaerobic ribonucleoside-triphosphate reductase